MLDRLYEAQSVWKRERNPVPLLIGIGSVVGLDTARLSTCYASPRPDQRTAKANSMATAIGVRVTPMFVVNERPVEGALPLAEFRRVIDAALLVTGLHR